MGDGHVDKESQRMWKDFEAAGLKALERGDDPVCEFCAAAAESGLNAGMLTIEKRGSAHKLVVNMNYCPDCGKKLRGTQ